MMTTYKKICVGAAILLLALLIFAITTGAPSLWTGAISIYEQFLTWDPIYQVLAGVSAGIAIAILFVVLKHLWRHRPDKRYGQCVSSIIESLPSGMDWHISCKSEEQWRSLASESYWETLQHNKFFIRKVYAQQDSLKACDAKIDALPKTHVQDKTIRLWEQKYQAARAQRAKVKLVWSYVDHDGVRKRKSAERRIDDILQSIMQSKDATGHYCFRAQYFMGIFQTDAAEDEPGCYIIFSCPPGTSEAQAETNYTEVYIGKSETVWNAVTTLIYDRKNDIWADIYDGKDVFIHIETCPSEELEKHLQYLTEQYSAN